MGIEVEIETEDVRLRPVKSEVDRLWASNVKARALAGWEPQYSGLDGFRRGIRETIDWFTVPENLATYRTGTYTV